MFDTYRKLHHLLDALERRNAVLLFIMMLMMGLLESIGVGSILPFLSIVANPEAVKSNSYLFALYEGFGFESADAFLVYFGAGVVVLVSGGLAFKALTHWAIARYSNMRSYTLSSRLLRGYLGRPYSFFLNRHSADLGKSILSEVETVVNSTLMPALNITANIIVAICIIGLVVAVSPKVAFSAVAFLGGTYALVYLALRSYINRIGRIRMNANRARFHMAQEALGGIKEVKVLGLEEGYIRGFRGPASRFAHVKAHNQVINEVPYFVLQALIFGGMMVLLLGLLIVHQGALEHVLPIVGLYAVAGTRLMPALDAVYRATTMLRFGKPALNALYTDLVEIEQAEDNATLDIGKREREPMRLYRWLELDGVRYTYPGAERPALDNLRLAISARTTVGVVGRTGAGKTTAVDLILGLLSPQQGRLLVDGKVVQGRNIRTWQRNIGYVPQSIFLADDTVAANIAFGVPPKEVSQEAVQRAARIAELHNFVIQEMPQGYATLVGERGVRLSGGQRQRIGIARAMYHDPDVLVLDEATSALDNRTEKAVMDAVHNLGSRKTIIIIAHRLSTVRECDRIFMLDNGRLAAEGTYDELSNNSEQFRAMAAGVI